MNFWMKRLHTSVHDLGKARVLSYLGYRNVSIFNRFIGPPSRENVNAGPMELIDEHREVAFIRDAYERTPDGQWCHVVHSVSVVIHSITRLRPELDSVRPRNVAANLGGRVG